MIEKFTSRFNGDGLLPHWLGLLIGALVGILFGLFVSDQADGYILEEVDDGSQIDEPTESSE